MLRRVFTVRALLSASIQFPALGQPPTSSTPRAALHAWTSGRSGEKLTTISGDGRGGALVTYTTVGQETTRVARLDLETRAESLEWAVAAKGIVGVWGSTSSDQLIVATSEQAPNRIRIVQVARHTRDISTVNLGRVYASAHYVHEGTYFAITSLMELIGFSIDNGRQVMDPIPLPYASSPVILSVSPDNIIAFDRAECQFWIVDRKRRLAKHVGLQTDAIDDAVGYIQSRRLKHASTAAARTLPLQWLAQASTPDGMICGLLAPLDRKAGARVVFFGPSGGLIKELRLGLPDPSRQPGIPQGWAVANQRICIAFPNREILTFNS